MDAVKVVISNDQKAVKIPTGIRMLIRRCCHAVLELDPQASSGSSLVACASIFSKSALFN